MNVAPQSDPNASRADGADEALRVMSFNVRVAPWVDVLGRWRRRSAAAAEIVRSARADLAGLQEPRRPQVDDLARRLEGFAWTGVGRGDGKDRGEFCPIFYRAERLELLDTGTFWLSPRPDSPGSWALAWGWLNLCRRICTWGEFRDRRTGRSFVHFNTHFTPLSARGRRQSALLLRRRIETIAGGGAAILTGDLNGTEHSEHYRILTAPDAGEGLNPDSALRDARRVSGSGHSGPTGTWLGRRRPTDPTVRLDYVLVSAGVEVLASRTLTCLPGPCPSDHLPILAEVVLA